MMIGCNSLSKFGPLLGRILLAAIFIHAGYGKLTGWDSTLGFMASKGIPLTNVVLALTILIELGGGLMIALGFYARWAALAIFLFLIPVTYIFHPFWVDPGEMNNFMKNVAIMGGMLYIMNFGSGRYSLNNSGC